MEARQQAAERTFPACGAGRRVLVTGGLCAAAVLLPGVINLALAGPTVGAWHGLVLKRPSPAVALHDTNGLPVALEDLRGQTIFLMFGYLRCPERCHTQAATLHAFATAVEAPDVRFLFVALDPDHDNAAELAAYFDARDPRFRALLPPSRSAAAALAEQFRSPVHYGPGDDGRVQPVAHAGHVFVIDPGGVVRLVYPAGRLSVDALLADWQRAQTAWNTLLET
ncbi:MAG: SCO family protein [Pseudomonadota bacterium]